MMIGNEGQKPYQSIAEIEAVVRGFEDCTIPPAKFTHRAHLTVALCYLSQSAFEEAATQMRVGLNRFLKHHHAQGYHETITLFWLKLVRHFLVDADASLTFCDLANELLNAYSNSQLIFDYYSRELIQTPEAKATWVEPDLRMLDF